MLSVNNIEVVYNGVILAVKGISLKVPEGRIVTLLGANGAGKSTVVKSISGLLKSEQGEITRGSIELRGRRIDDEKPEKIVGMGVCHVPEGRRVFPDLTVAENLKIGAFSRKDSKVIRNDFNRVLVYFTPLKERMNLKAGYLSGGEQQMLAIGRALMGRPSLLMLDEPSLGLAPLLVREIFEIIKSINREGNTSILLVEQNANMALSIAHHGYIIENGIIVMDDCCEGLRRNDEVREFYLGISEEGRRKSFADVKYHKRKKRWLS